MKDIICNLLLFVLLAVIVATIAAVIVYGLECFIYMFCALPVVVAYCVVNDLN